jgi:hypothetical protein
MYTTSLSIGTNENNPRHSSWYEVCLHTELHSNLRVVSEMKCAYKRTNIHDQFIERFYPLQTKKAQICKEAPEDMYTPHCRGWRYCPVFEIYWLQVLNDSPRFLSSQCILNQLTTSHNLFFLRTSSLKSYCHPTLSNLFNWESVVK